jgi:hypothetical protein
MTPKVTVRGRRAIPIIFVPQMIFPPDDLVPYVSAYTAGELTALFSRITSAYF